MGHESDPQDPKTNFINLMLEMLNVPHDKLKAPSRREEESETMRVFRLMASEFNNTNLEYRLISPLKGVLIAWEGQRTICLDIESNNPSRDVDILFHMLGHIALEHIDETQFTMRFESDDTEYKQGSEAEEREADAWAKVMKQRKQWPSF